MGAHDQPRTRFGQRHLSGRLSPAKSYLAPPPKKPGRGIAVTGGALLVMLVMLAVALWAWQEIAALNAQTAQAEQTVISIVNQPITHLARTPAAEVFSPGWFHPGAIRPDFSTVDIRATQEFPYSASTYVASDVDPTEMFVSKQLEFNAMTKAFYSDRTLPKKRLSEDEMQQINRLYRVIAHGGQASTLRWAILAGLAALLVALGAMLSRAIRVPA
jgi:hypothetical protein